MENNPNYANLTEESKAKAQEYLDKLYMYNTTTLPQINNSETRTILTPNEFQTIYKHTPKTIKEALKQASTIFPTPSTPSTNTNNPHHTQISPQATHTTNPPPPTNGPRTCNSNHNKRKDTHQKRQMGSKSHPKTVLMPMATLTKDHTTMAQSRRITTSG